MKLARIVALKFNTEKEQIIWPATRVRDVDIKGLGFNGKDRSILYVYACKTIETPPRIDEKFLEIPDVHRIDIDDAITTFADFVMISDGAYTNIMSVVPHTALIPETDDDKDFLRKFEKFNFGKLSLLSSMKFKIDVSHLSNLSDRYDGIRLLSRATTSNDYISRFNYCYRLFERAFGIAGRDLAGPLSDFLKLSSFGYDRSEIDGWIKARNRISHADNSRIIFVDNMICWETERATQAGFDVLMNKENWFSSDIDRRNLWHPSQGTFNKQTNCFYTRGINVDSPFRPFDQYGSFEMLMDDMSGILPSDWWYGDKESFEEVSIKSIQIREKDGSVYKTETLS